MCQGSTQTSYLNNFMCERVYRCVKLQTCLVYVLSLTSFFDSCICSWEVYAKVFSGETVSLQKRRGKMGGGKERQKEEVRDRERKKREKEIPYLTSCHKLFSAVKL